MSATRRGEGSQRIEADVYLTPDWVIKRLLEAYRPPGGTWLDPCAANGNLIKVVKTLRPDVKMCGFELRAECAPALEAVSYRHGIVDFLTLVKDVSQAFEVVLTNPPYSLAEEFIRESMAVAKVTIMLLRLNFLRGSGRDEFFRKNPCGIFVLADRPSFTGYGTDATEYAWMVWGDPEVAGRWQMLARTSDEEKAEWNARARALNTKPEKEAA